MDNLNWREQLEHFKIPIGLSLLGIVLILGGVFASGRGTKQEFPKKSLVEKEMSVSIDVSGAVNKPGVYQLTSESRIEQAIEAAGGFTELANEEYISKYLNMAQKLSDGSKVYVPFSGEDSVGLRGAVAGTKIQGKVNINISSQAEIETLPGIGPVTASKIISGRPYQQTEDILSRKIVGRAVFEKIKDSLVVY